jgi:two-component system sensor histidine kinase BaeS
LRQILDNLIANALQATPAGGSVSLSVRRSDRRVTIRVTDTGAGLPPGIMTGRGSGAGLTLCHQLARAMEGTLLLENAAGSGAVASLCLPAAGEKLTDPISPSRIMPRPSGTQATRPPPPHAADRG